MRSIDSHINKSNTNIIVILLCLTLTIQLITYYVTTLKGLTLPMGRLIFGLSIFGCIALYFRNNNLWRKAEQNPLLIIYCIYVTCSFFYGLWKYKTVTNSVFDYWLFIYIPSIILIPPFSFNLKVFDRVLGLFVCISSAGMLLALFSFPEVRYDRLIFSDYMLPLAHIGVSSGYLLLKYASRISTLTFIGLFGVLFDSAIYGVVGAFRGRMILAIILIVFFILIQLRTTKIGFGWKFLTLSTAMLMCCIALYTIITRFSVELETVTMRFSQLHERYETTGNLMSSDGRLAEFDYFMQIHPSWKLIPGHGVGAVWYDVLGMYAESEGETRGKMIGLRSMLHMNWLHILFKIGVIGFVLLLAVLIRHYKTNRIFIKGNIAWWMFLVYYFAWTTYYGDKALDMRAMVLLFILVHPWLFRSGPPVLLRKNTIPNVQHMHQTR